MPLKKAGERRLRAAEREGWEGVREAACPATAIVCPVQGSFHFIPSSFIHQLLADR